MHKKHLGISSLSLHRFESYITPNIIEERQMNVAMMSVFDRLMMDRIIFLGTGINDIVVKPFVPNELYRKVFFYIFQ